MVEKIIWCVVGLLAVCLTISPALTLLVVLYLLPLAVAALGCVVMAVIAARLFDSLR